MDMLNRINECIKLIKRELDKSNLERDIVSDDPAHLTQTLLMMTMYLHEFNFYPSDMKGNCCEVAFFASLQGERWRLRKNQKTPFDQMFKNLINHCQGICSTKTKYAIIIADNWDDDVANFWQPNIDILKSMGVSIQVFMMIGKVQSNYPL
jgi:hypothetical protein